MFNSINFNFLSCTTKAIINPLGVDALFVTEFYGGAATPERSADLMDIIARLKTGDRLYLGAILGYHN